MVDSKKIFPKVNVSFPIEWTANCIANTKWLLKKTFTILRLEDKWIFNRFSVRCQGSVVAKFLIFFIKTVCKVGKKCLFISPLSLTMINLKKKPDDRNLKLSLVYLQEGRGVPISSLWRIINLKLFLWKEEEKLNCISGSKKADCKNWR